MNFEPDSIIPLYPRDYLYLEDKNYCLGFSVLSDRIILGGLFMRNYDILFDRENRVVQMVRSNCNPKAGFDFEKYYINHSDDPKAYSEQASSSTSSPVLFGIGWLCVCLLLILITGATIYWRLFSKRFTIDEHLNYESRSPNMAIEVVQYDLYSDSQLQ